ncbi:MAG: RES family NAD+ phosphorylase [Pseudolabrys sp.]
MELTPAVIEVRLRDTHRLIPSRYPPVGVFDAVASADDVQAVVALEGWTNDRLSAELGALHVLPKTEWLTGVPNASVIMAAFCHPHPQGGRFSTPELGAWYAALTLETALAETAFHRMREFDEIGVTETFVHMRQYLADFDTSFHDVRPSPTFDACYDPDSYTDGQALCRELRPAGSNGVCFRSVRHRGGECIACYRPKLVGNVRQGAHFEYRWEGRREPHVTRLDG